MKILKSFEEIEGNNDYPSQEELKEIVLDLKERMEKMENFLAYKRGTDVIWSNFKRDAN